MLKRRQRTGAATGQPVTSGTCQYASLFRRVIVPTDDGRAGNGESMEKRAIYGGLALPMLLLLPQLAITIVFFYWPASQAVWQSFLLQDAFGLKTSFVWFENYRDLFRNPDYYKALGTTLVFSTAVAALSLSLALLLAVQADKHIRGADAYKTLLIWPYAVAPAVAGVLWLFMFQPSLGMIARLLRSFGVDWNPLLNGGHAMILVVLAATWKQISYNFLFFLAGLQSIPRSVIEAAAIDGAKPRRRFWTIVFPLLSPTTFFLLVVNVVYVFFDTFGIIDVMTSGGPSKATETLVYKVYTDGKLGSDLGGSAAQSVILLILVIALTAVQFRFIERKVTY
jgi:sn-glycerol 3-phosphate transport system permease protein